MCAEARSAAKRHAARALGPHTAHRPHLPARRHLAPFRPAPHAGISCIATPARRAARRARDFDMGAGRTCSWAVQGRRAKIAGQTPSPKSCPLHRQDGMPSREARGAACSVRQNSFAASITLRDETYAM